MIGGDGGGTITFAGTAANTYGGATTVSNGTLILSKTGAIALPGNFSMANNTTVTLAGSGQICATAAVNFTATNGNWRGSR